jgi:hypothetical protein
MARRTPEQVSRLREALLAIDDLRKPDYRNDYIQRWESRTGGSVPRFTDARHDLGSLLRTADQVSDGMRAWAEIVADGQGHTEAGRRFLDLLDGGAGPASTPAPAAVEDRPSRVFVSYSHDDDQVSYLRISTFVDDLAAAYRNVSGTPAGIFRDTAGIRLGEDWRDALEHAGRTATILLAFVSPSYLRSEWCRREATDFLDRPGPGTLVPLLLFERHILQREFAEDPLWQRLERLQMVPGTLLRTAERGSAGWLQLRDRIAQRIAEILAG